MGQWGFLRRRYIGNVVGIAYDYSNYNSDAFADGAAEITFSVLADEYIKGTFSGVVYREIILTESGETQGLDPITIESGEFYAPIKMGQWPYK